MRADNSQTGDISLKFIRIIKCNQLKYVVEENFPELKKICSYRLKGLKVVPSKINEEMHT